MSVFTKTPIATAFLQKWWETILPRSVRLRSRQVPIRKVCTGQEGKISRNEHFSKNLCPIQWWVPGRPTFCGFVFSSHRVIDESNSSGPRTTHLHWDNSAFLSEIWWRYCITVPWNETLAKVYGACDGNLKKKDLDLSVKKSFVLAVKVGNDVIPIAQHCYWWSSRGTSTGIQVSGCYLDENVRSKSTFHISRGATIKHFTRLSAKISRDSLGLLAKSSRSAFWGFIVKHVDLNFRNFGSYARNWQVSPLHARNLATALHCIEANSIVN